MKRFLSISFCALALGSTALAGTVLAQPAAPAEAPKPKGFALEGKLISLDGMKLTVEGADGKPRSVMLTADTRLIRVSKISIDQIKPGSFVATANSADAGVSSELRVFAPPLNGLGEGSFPMQDGENMTNGTVNTVVTSAKGRELDVGYAPKCKDHLDSPRCKSGTRHITVPADMVIRQWDKIEVGALKPGIAVSAQGYTLGDAAPVIRAVFIGENGAPPPK
ncbi:MAG TPA: hypothetical protein VG407_17155 [Caulobacteraceae bacterium]|jgi:hypothetical protein|nr:hypothetical protein [Caulobacteraceae bacterium]